jgi:D-alanyl-D-alanine carboxypeptidase-like protein
MGERRSGPLGLGYGVPQGLTLVEPMRAPSGAGLDRARTLGLAGGDLHFQLKLSALEAVPYPADFKLQTSFLLAGNPTYLAFKHRVLEGQIRRAKGLGRSFIATLPEATLDLVENGQKMKKAAAAQCRALLKAARAALDGPGQKHSSLRALSGYRTVEKEQQLWDGYFEKYYLATQEARDNLPEGPHSEAAVRLMVAYVSDRKAAPGYGNHSAGIAMDFSTSVGKVTFSASMSQKAGWKKTPFHAWLVTHAKEFKFHPYVKEPWHWEFKE